MSKTVTLNLSDYTYEFLKRTSVQTGQTPEQLIVKLLERQVKDNSTDPLLQLAGVFESTQNDISDNHDAYIGDSLKE